jgi:MFS family permease
MTVAGLRGMANVAFLPFLALYLGLDEELGLGNASLGLHIALLVGVGVFATPLTGYISDRFGRKLVLIPGLIGLSALTALLIPFGEGIGLLIILACLGTFLFSDQPILTVAALDVGESGSQYAVGLLFFPVRSCRRIPSYRRSVIRCTGNLSCILVHIRDISCSDNYLAGCAFGAA